MRRDRRCDGFRYTEIYTLSDPTSGEIRYVGKTTEGVERRLRDHLRGKSGPYCKKWIESLRVTGLTPKLNIVEICSDTWIEREQFWILFFARAGCRLTNLTDGGEGHVGRRHTEETRRKMSLAATGRVLSAEHRAKVSAARKGRPLSEEVRRNMSLGRTGIKFTDEHKRKIGAASRGRKHTPQEIENMRRRQTGKKLSEETKRRLSVIGRAKKLTPEHCRKISIAMTANHPMKGKRHTPEALRKMSEWSREYWRLRKGGSG